MAPIRSLRNLRFRRPLAASAALAAALLLTGRSALAEPITYTLSGVFTGNLGTSTLWKPFNRRASTLTFTGDTQNIHNLGEGFYTNTVGTATIDIAGIGQATFLSPTFGVESEFNSFSFYDIPNNFAVGVYNDFLGTYDLSALSGAISGTPLLLGAGEATSLGSLSFNDLGGSLSATATPTPEPSSILLLGTGLVGMAGLLRRLTA